MSIRRLLLAQQGGYFDEVFGEIPPESTSFGWPLYITVPFEEETDYYIIYRKEGNSIGSSLYNWIMSNKILVDDTSAYIRYECYPQLYINGQRINTIEIEIFNSVVQSIFFNSDKIYEGTITEDGELTLYVLK